MAQKVTLPPNNREAETTVLGAILLNGEALGRVSGWLFPPEFYNNNHNLIFRAMRRLQGRNQAVDLVTVVAELQSRGELERVGGAYYITGLAEGVISASNIEHHARLVKVAARNRELLKLARELEAACLNEGPDLEAFEYKLLKISRRDGLGHIEDLAKVDSEVWSQFLATLEHPGQYRGIPSGFPKIDQLSSGLPPGEMIVLAARPGMGKTALALSIGLNVATAGGRVGFISLEMTVQQLYRRMLFRAARVDAGRYNEGQLTEEDRKNAEAAREQLLGLNLYMVDQVEPKIEAVLAAGRRLMIAKRIDLLILDYLQLIRDSRRQSLYESITIASGLLKNLARRLDIPVLVLAQINRRSEDRPDKKPRMSDLRDSGAIEQDADQVWLLHRPEAYGFRMDNRTGDNLHGRAELLIEKNRNGRLGAAWLAFVDQYVAFENLQQDEPVAPGG